MKDVELKGAMAVELEMQKALAKLSALIAQGRSARLLEIDKRWAALSLTSTQSRKLHHGK